MTVSNSAKNIFNNLYLNKVKLRSYLFCILLKSNYNFDSFISNTSTQLLFKRVPAAASWTYDGTGLTSLAFLRTSLAHSSVFIKVETGVASHTTSCWQAARTTRWALRAAGQSRQIIACIALAAGALVLKSANRTVFHRGSASYACWTVSIPNSSIWTVTHGADRSGWQGTCDCACVITLQSIPLGTGLTETIIWAGCAWVGLGA